jgi:hypothetical protein
LKQFQTEIKAGGCICHFSIAKHRLIRFSNCLNCVVLFLGCLLEVSRIESRVLFQNSPTTLVFWAASMSAMQVQSTNDSFSQKKFHQECNDSSAHNALRLQVSGLCLLAIFCPFCCDPSCATQTYWHPK